MRTCFIKLRVKDLDRSLDYYIRAMRMKLFGIKDYPEARVTLVFLGYARIIDSVMLQLSYKWK